MKIGRNDTCPCGSGKKYKKCCMSLEETLTKTSTLPADISPADIVRVRTKAFGEGNFGLIYDTYHPDSNFMGHFPNRDEYLLYGKSILGKEYRIQECRVLKEKFEDEEAWVIFCLDIVFEGTRSEALELARFMQTPQGWRYHSSLKMERAQYDGSLEDLDFSDFDNLDGQVWY